MRGRHTDPTILPEHPLRASAVQGTGSSGRHSPTQGSVNTRIPFPGVLPSEARLMAEGQRPKQGTSWDTLPPPSPHPLTPKRPYGKNLPHPCGSIPRWPQLFQWQISPRGSQRTGRERAGVRHSPRRPAGTSIWGPGLWGREGMPGRDGRGSTELPALCQGQEGKAAGGESGTDPRTDISKVSTKSQR